MPPMTNEQYDSINAYLATNPNADALAAAQQQYGVTADDLAAARSYAGASNSTPSTTPAVAPTNDWMPNQWYNPNVMPENFDFQRYIDANKDLGLAGIDTQEEAMRHYFNYGEKEGRSIGALAPKRYEDLSQEDRRSGMEAYRQATNSDGSVIFNPGTDSSTDPALSWINQNYIPQGQFKTDYAAAKPADKFELLNTLETSTRPPDQLASIRTAWEANKDKPGEMRKLMEDYGVTLGDLSQATGETYSQLNNWVKNGNLLGSIGFSVNKPGAYDKFKATTTAKYDPNATVVAGPSTAASREADYRSSQQRAANTFDPVAYAKDPEAYVKKMREEGGLAALVAEKAVPSSTGTQASIPTSYQQPEKITAANFQSEYDKLRADSNVNEDQQRKFLTSALEDPTIKAKLGDKLQPVLDELNRPPGERMLGQIEKQRGALGGQYYQGVYSDPKTMAKILEDKGVKSLADLGQKEKFRTSTAEVQYTSPYGPVTKFNDGSFGYIDNSGDETSKIVRVNPDEMQATYGRYVTDGNGETKFTPLRGEELATLKDGQFTESIGNVVINKRTGEELTDTTRQLAYQSSSGGVKKKHNHLVVEFLKDGTPVLMATKEKAGLGAALQDAMPLIAMALPFILPGIGAALSGALPGAAVAASGATAAIPASLMNTALTQGIISGGLGSLTGKDFGKSFLSGAISPVISSGIGSLMPNMGLDAASGAGKAITGIGTNVLSGALQGGDFGDLLKQGVIGGATSYGLGEATKGLDLTPQQLNMATGVVAPLLRGQKIDPFKVLSSAITSGAQVKPKEAVPGNAKGGLLEGFLPVKVPGNAYSMDPRMFTGIAGNLMARST